MPSVLTNLDQSDLGYVVEQVWGPGIARGHARALTTGPVPTGWEVREEYWAIPSARTAQLLVPRDRRIAARALSDYARLRPRTKRLARQGLAVAARVGAPLGRDTLRIIAPEGTPPTAVADIAAQVGDPRARAAFGVRTAANAKPTLELRDRAGEAIGFVKLAWNEITRAAIGREATGLRTMGVRSRPEILAPGLIAEGAVEDSADGSGRPFVMVAPLPRGIRHVPAEFASLRRTEALGPGTVHRLGRIAETAQYRSCVADLDCARGTAPRTLVDQARALASRVAACPDTAPIANFWHGDFTWWNMGRDPRGHLWLFDWETAQPDAPAGLDTLHWFAHAKDAENPASVVARAEASTAHVAPILRSLGHSPTSASALAAWYAVTLVAGEITLAETLQSWERIKHPVSTLEHLLAWGSLQLARSAH